ncbi:MAG: hypothetical protein ABSA57_13025 [Candidatus Acidiferrales bacterium]|jgi:hypothetical protein
MKKYTKPSLKELGLLREVTKFSDPSRGCYWGHDGSQTPVCRSGGDGNFFFTERSYDTNIAD